MPVRGWKTIRKCVDTSVDRWNGGKNWKDPLETFWLKPSCGLLDNTYKFGCTILTLLQIKSMLRIFDWTVHFHLHETPQMPRLPRLPNFKLYLLIVLFPGKYKRGECANNQSANVVSLLFKKVPPWGDIGFQQRIRSRLSVNSIKGGASSIPPIHPPAASNRSNFSILHPSFVLPEGSQREKSLQIRHDLLDVKV